MTKKEREDFAIDIATFLDLHECAEPEEVANNAIEMIKCILNRHPKLRFEMYEMGCSDHLDNLGLDSGSPW